MSQTQLTSLIVVLVALLIFCAVFTFIYRYYTVATGKEYLAGEEDGDILLDGLEREKHNKKASTKVGKIVSKVVSYTLLVLCGCLLVFGVYGKLANDDIPFGNSTVLVIGSGSMSEKNAANDYLVENELNNQFDTGDLVFISKVAQDDIALYDVVAFKNGDGYTIVHRITAFHTTTDTDGNTVTYYTTRGDANNADDNYYADGATVLYYSNIIGRYTNVRIRYIGNFIYFLQSYQGWATIVALLYCLFIFDHYTDKLSSYEEERLKTLLSCMGLNLPDKGKLPPFRFNLDRAYLPDHSFFFHEGIYLNCNDKALNCLHQGQMILVKNEMPILMDIETREITPISDLAPYLTPPLEEEKPKKKKKDKNVKPIKEDSPQ